VVIVRNPEFRTTNTAESMSLGARACKGKTLFLDGDLLIRPASISEFVRFAASCDILMGIAPTRSEQPVCVEFVDQREGEREIPFVSNFSREARTTYEWANVVAGPHHLMDEVSGYVFERLRREAPLPAMPLDLREVDTLADLEAARIFAVELEHSA
jgi:hypothetical protein